MHVITCTKALLWAAQLCKQKSGEVKFQMQYSVVTGLFDQTCVDAVISIIYQDSLLGNSLYNTREIECLSD